HQDFSSFQAKSNASFVILAISITSVSLMANYGEASTRLRVALLCLETTGPSVRWPIHLD
ncbi:hypothetical protein ACCT09_54710, partial [Rhizobium ruizarguesonis]